jgi:hypothetical protein
MLAMSNSRIAFASAIVGALFVGGVIGATGIAHLIAPASAATASQSPSPKSNEAASHEAGESAAHEQAENNGTFHPDGGPNGGPNGLSNETSAHEAGEPAAREASEKS